MIQASMRFFGRGGGPGRARTPTVLQMEAAECGAASLAIILGHHRRFVPLEELRELCGVSRDGSKASSMLRVARKFGLKAKGFRRYSKTVLKGPFPSVVFWNANHYLVVEGASRDRVFLNDPAFGPRAVSHEEFARSYSGIVLTFEKGPSFSPAGTPPKLISRLTGEARAYLVHTGFVLFLGILIAIPGFAVPAFTGVFVDDVLVHQFEDWLEPLAMVMAIAIIIQAVLSWLKDITLLRVQMAMSLERSADFIWHVLRLPAAFFAARFLGDIANRVNSVERVARLLTSDLGSAAINGLTAALLLVLMALLDPLLAATAIGGASINVVMLQMLRRARGDISIRLQTEMGKLFATTVNGLRMIETLKATGGEDNYFGKWAGYHARVTNSQQELARLVEISAVLPALVATLTVALALVIGGTRVMDGVLTLGALLAFQVLFSSITAPIQVMVETAGRTQEAVADLSRLDDVFRNAIDWRHEPRADTSEASLPSTSGLRLRDVSFGYSPLDPPLIDKLNVEVPPGGWIALVGASGSGKSTIGKLVSGLYEPWSGDLLLDGRPLKSFERPQLSRLVSTVDQDISLFEGTVRENICLWDRTIPHENVVEAARDAEILEEISRMPENFDAFVEENGRNLSGGQRQRIEIARALVRLPSVLVLDEATSALDPTTEHAIITALRRRGITCVLVAHRLSTVRDCDEILVLDGGRIVERGPHADLVANQGAYARLIADDDS